MSLFHFLKGVKSRLEKIQRDFLLGGGNLKRIIHLVSWNAVCLSKEKGGLGIRSLTTLMGVEVCSQGQPYVEKCYNPKISN